VNLTRVSTLGKKVLNVSRERDQTLNYKNWAALFLWNWPKPIIMTTREDMAQSSPSTYRTVRQASFMYRLWSLMGPPTPKRQGHLFRPDPTGGGRGSNFSSQTGRFILYAGAVWHVAYSTHAWKGQVETLFKVTSYLYRPDPGPQVFTRVTISNMPRTFLPPQPTPRYGPRFTLISWFFSMQLSWENVFLGSLSCPGCSRTV
jgi:hypothetical protein